jgi:hypothetical protein
VESHVIKLWCADWATGVAPRQPGVARRVMRVSDEYVAALGRPMTVRRPDGQVRCGVVALHGAMLPQRDQPLFEHLAETLTLG